MTPNQVFTIKFERLRAIIDGDPGAHLIELASILRQFFVDRSPLVNQVNRNYELKLSFTVGLSARERAAEMPDFNLPIPHTILLAIPPPNEAKRQVNSDQLLAHEVVKIEDNYYTARELLDACANKMGGVHFDQNGAEHEIVRDIGSLGEFLEPAGLGSAFSVLLFLARAAYSGLLPLHTAIKKA